MTSFYSFIWLGQIWEWKCLLNSWGHLINRNIRMCHIDEIPGCHSTVW
jgi:hypothetical protein